ncbi:MAG: class III signal peptide-containing protein, partial [Candidatus Omnitrophica bacterium]|nr:class III signal peptide-containing protein [Candidatus Omnitrophota bacterium]
MLIKLRKAQATAEYAILFAVVIGAAMGVQSYVKKAIQARIFDA